MKKSKNDKFGFWSIVLLAINSIIGSGIFLTPGSVVSQVGSKALLVYFIAAVLAAILAISFAAAAKYVAKSADVGDDQAGCCNQHDDSWFYCFTVNYVLVIKKRARE